MVITSESVLQFVNPDHVLVVDLDYPSSITTESQDSHTHHPTTLGLYINGKLV